MVALSVYRRPPCAVPRHGLDCSCAPLRSNRENIAKLAFSLDHCSTIAVSCAVQALISKRTEQVSDNLKTSTLQEDKPSYHNAKANSGA